MSTEQVEALPRNIVIQEGCITAWQCSQAAPLIRRASTDRKWMSDADKKFPYRCLPLVIANSFGWDIINPVPFTATWNGGRNPGDVKIHWPPQKRSNIPQAHFGVGVLTFTLAYLFQTPPGINLYVKGPCNDIKDGITPLEGIVETDWSPATFTMNWIFTRPNHQVTFDAGESFCRIFPIPRHMTEFFQPQMKMIEDNPGLHEQYSKWAEKRAEFNNGLKIPGSEFVKRGWQKEYFQGGGSDYWPKGEGHQTRLQQEDFKDLRPQAARQFDMIPDSQVEPFKIRMPEGGEFTVFLPNPSN